MTNLPFKIVENSNKQIPCNIEAEQAVIGSILVSNDIYDEISPIIDAQKFFDPIHIKIFDLPAIPTSGDFDSLGNNLDGCSLYEFLFRLLNIR